MSRPGHRPAARSPARAAPGPAGMPNPDVTTEQYRASEIEEYARQYATGHYGMGRGRQISVEQMVGKLVPRGTLLDVSTGRGETLTYALAAGHSPTGTEVVAALIAPDRDPCPVKYAEAHALPFADQSFDHVTCFDVLEHLIEDDIRPALAEMRRVARFTVTVSASSRSSIFGDGRELHISRRPVHAWDALLKSVLGDECRRNGLAGGTPCWQAVYRR